VSGVRAEQPREHVSISGRDKRLLSSGKLVDQLWDPCSPPPPLFKEYQVLFPRWYSFRGCGVSTSDVKNECSYNLLPLHGVPSCCAHDQLYLTQCIDHTFILLFHKIWGYTEYFTCNLSYLQTCKYTLKVYSPDF
jgi:hypothetical protein